MGKERVTQGANKERICCLQMPWDYSVKTGDFRGWYKTPAFFVLSCLIGLHALSSQRSLSFQRSPGQEEYPKIRKLKTGKATPKELPDPIQNTFKSGAFFTTRGKTFFHAW